MRSREGYSEIAGAEDEEAPAEAAGASSQACIGDLVHNPDANGGRPIGNPVPSEWLGFASSGIRAERQLKKRQRSLKNTIKAMIASNRLSKSKRWEVPGSVPGIDMSSTTVANTNLAAQFHVPARVTVSEFSSTSVRVQHDVSLDELASLIRNPLGESTVRWINVDGLNWDVVQELATRFNLHPLACEDTLHVPQRTKADFYDGCMYLCMLAMRLRAEDEATDGTDGTCASPQETSPEGDWGAFLDGRVEVQQVSIFLLQRNVLLTIFLSSSRSYTDPLLEQLRGEGTLLRDSADASFLMYRVMDAIVDHMGLISEEYDKILDHYEAKVTNGSLRAAYTQKLYGYQRELIQINRMIAPLQMLLSNLRARDKQNTKMLTQLTAVYLNDVLDHVGTASEVVRGLSDECRDLISLIFNLTAHRQSIATQTLAVVSAVFLPITFLAGVYGVNFESVPEFKWAHGYSYFWSLCCVITALFSWILQRMGMFATYE